MLTNKDARFQCKECEWSSNKESTTTGSTCSVALLSALCCAQECDHFYYHGFETDSKKNKISSRTFLNDCHINQFTLFCFFSPHFYYSILFLLPTFKKKYNFAVIVIAVRRGFFPPGFLKLIIVLMLLFYSLIIDDRYKEIVRKKVSPGWGCFFFTVTPLSPDRPPYNVQIDAICF